MSLTDWASDALDSGKYEDEEDLCNQTGCNYDDIYDDKDPND